MSFGLFSINGSFNLGGLFGPLYGEETRTSLAQTRVEAPINRQLALRIMPIEGATTPPTPFDILMDELEERFLARCGGSYVAIRTIIVSLYLDKRLMLDETLSRHGYRIKDETIL